MYTFVLLFHTFVPYLQERARNQVEIDELNELIKNNKEKLIKQKKQARAQEKVGL